MAIQHARSGTRTEVLEGAVLNALIVLLVATLAAVVATYVSPAPAAVAPTVVTEVADYPTAMRYAWGQVRLVDDEEVTKSLIEFRAAEKGFMSAEQRSLIEFRAGERQ